MFKSIALLLLLLPALVKADSTVEAEVSESVRAAAKAAILLRKPSILNELVSNELLKIKGAEDVSNWAFSSEEFFKTVNIFQIQLDDSEPREIAVEIPSKCGIVGCPHFLFKVDGDSPLYLGTVRLRSIEDFKQSRSGKLRGGFRDFFVNSNSGYTVFRYNPDYKIYYPY